MKSRLIKMSGVVLMMAALLLPSAATANTEGRAVTVQDQVDIFAHSDLDDDFLNMATTATTGLLNYLNDQLNTAFTKEATVYLFPDAETRVQGMMNVTGASEEVARRRLGMRNGSPGPVALAFGPVNIPELNYTIWMRLDHRMDHFLVLGVAKTTAHELMHLWEFSQIAGFSPRDQTPSSWISEAIAEGSAFEVIFHTDLATSDILCGDHCRQVISQLLREGLPAPNEIQRTKGWSRFSRETDGMSYLVVGAYMQYLFDEHNPQGPVEYYDWINQGVGPNQAFQQAFGIEPDLNDSDFHDFLRVFISL